MSYFNFKSVRCKVSVYWQLCFLVNEESIYLKMSLTQRNRDTESIGDSPELEFVSGTSNSRYIFFKSRNTSLYETKPKSFASMQEPSLFGLDLFF